LCVLAGLVAFACSFAFGKIPGLVACGTFAGSGQLGPILAFELARTPGDVAALFGSGACRASLIDAQNTGLWLDALGFIPSYTAFLVLAAIYGFWVLPNAMMMAGFTYAWFAILVTAIVASFAAGTFAPRVARISR
jgi:hypothetical protein